MVNNHAMEMNKSSNCGWIRTMLRRRMKNFRRHFVGGGSRSVPEAPIQFQMLLIRFSSKANRRQLRTWVKRIDLRGIQMLIKLTWLWKFGVVMSPAPCAACVVLFFKKDGPFPASFVFIFVFSKLQLVEYRSLLMLLMGIEPRTSGVGSDRSTNWATTTAPVM